MSSSTTEPRPFAVRIPAIDDLCAHTRRLHHANPLNRRERIAVWSGVVIFLITIAVSTALDKASTAELVAGSRRRSW